MSNYGGKPDTMRTTKLGDGDLTLTFDGNAFSLSVAERKLVEDLLQRIEQHEKPTATAPEPRS